MSCWTTSACCWRSRAVCARDNSLCTSCVGDMRTWGMPILRRHCGLRHTHRGHCSCEEIFIAGTVMEWSNGIRAPAKPLPHSYANPSWVKRGHAEGKEAEAEFRPRCVGEEVFQQKHIARGSIHELGCKVACTLFHVLPSWCESLVGSTLQNRKGRAQCSGNMTILWEMHNMIEHVTTPSLEENVSILTMESMTGCP